MLSYQVALVLNIKYVQILYILSGLNISSHICGICFEIILAKFN